MRIYVTSVFVEDQAHALDFYTNVLGFKKKTDEPAGEFRWLTVVSPEEPDGVELLLEPSDNPATQAFKEALRDQGIPATMFAVDDLEAEHERLQQQGVEFVTEPTEYKPGVRLAVFDDTCGNLIQIAEIE